MSMTPILDVQGLGKAFGAVTVAEDQSWSLAPGEALGVIGPNGAGKTSMFNLVTGALTPDAGTIRLEGQDITRCPPRGAAGRGSPGPSRCPSPSAA